jgi:hypothetical protein
MINKTLSTMFAVYVAAAVPTAHASRAAHTAAPTAAAKHRAAAATDASVDWGHT